MRKLFLIIIMMGLMASGCSPKLGGSDQPSTPKTNQPSQQQQEEESAQPQEDEDEVSGNILPPKKEDDEDENKKDEDKEDIALEDKSSKDDSSSNNTIEEDKNISNEVTMSDSERPAPYTDVFVAPDNKSSEVAVDDYNHKLVGFAWMVGGGLVFGTSMAVERIGTRLYDVFSRLQPGIAALQFREHRQIYNITLKAMEKLHIRKNVAKKILRKFMYAGSARALSVKRGGSKILQWLGRAGKVGGAVISVFGVIEMVLEPTDLADAEIRPEDRFEDLKRAVFSLEENPQDKNIQDCVLRSVISYLPDVINSLKLEYNEYFYALEEAMANQELSSEDKETAQKEFNEFEVEQTKLIDFFQNSLETLSRLYYATDVDRSHANEILKENVQKLEQILEEKQS